MFYNAGVVRKFRNGASWLSINQSSRNARQSPLFIFVGCAHCVIDDTHEMIGDFHGWFSCLKTPIGFPSLVTKPQACHKEWRILAVAKQTLFIGTVFALPIETSTEEWVVSHMHSDMSNLWKKYALQEGKVIYAGKTKFNVRREEGPKLWLYIQPGFRLWKNCV